MPALTLDVGNSAATAEDPDGSHRSRLIRPRRRPKGGRFAPCHRRTALLSVTTTVVVVDPAAAHCTRITDDSSLPSLRVADVHSTVCLHPITTTTDHYHHGPAATMVLQKQALLKLLRLHYVISLRKSKTLVSVSLLMEGHFLLI